MNKKQLTESIMAGVRRAFRENKSLNEGFSAWKEENRPKFDMQGFWKNDEILMKLLLPLVVQKYVSQIDFGVKGKDGNFVTIAKIMHDANNIKSACENIQNGVSRLIKHFESDQNKVDQSLAKSLYYVYIVENSDLYEFINQNVDGMTYEDGSKRISGLDEIKYDTNENKLEIPTSIIMNKESLVKLIKFLDDENSELLK